MPEGTEAAALKIRATTAILFGADGVVASEGGGLAAPPISIVVVTSIGFPNYFHPIGFQRPLPPSLPRSSSFFLVGAMGRVSPSLYY